MVVLRVGSCALEALVGRWQLRLCYRLLENLMVWGFHPNWYLFRWLDSNGKFDVAYYRKVECSV